MTTDTLTRVFAALADPTRRDMVARLAEGDATANQLAEPYRMTLQAGYKHLRVLEDAGLVTRPPGPEPHRMTLKAAYKHPRAVEGAGLVPRPPGPQPRAVHLEVQVFALRDTWIGRHRRRAEQRYRRLDALLAEFDETETNGDEA